VPPKVRPFALALAVSVLVFAAASLEPYFAGDVNLARVIQAMSPGTEWASAITSLATAPAKYIVMTAAVMLAWWLGGWKGAVIAIGAIAIEQVGGEASKLIARRPRPSPDLIAVVGKPAGFSFPSTFTTFIAVTFGTVWLLARRSRQNLAPVVASVTAMVIVLGWGARIVLGAHWPSDVVLTTAVCMTWLWATVLVVDPRG
jgi:membrane-associated phospholipid phosphatase